uniref:Uncharacterized protein n=1 Tax=Anguilla anguilla TaxID=7936 RepID=A0A0E9UEL0_ANGAN
MKFSYFTALHKLLVHSRNSLIVCGELFPVFVFFKMLNHTPLEQIHRLPL